MAFRSTANVFAQLIPQHAPHLQPVGSIDYLAVIGCQLRFYWRPGVLDANLVDALLHEPYIKELFTFPLQPTAAPIAVINFRLVSDIGEHHAETRNAFPGTDFERVSVSEYWHISIIITPTAGLPPPFLPPPPAQLAPALQDWCLLEGAKLAKITSARKTRELLIARDQLGIQQAITAHQTFCRESLLGNIRYYPASRIPTSVNLSPSRRTLVLHGNVGFTGPWIAAPSTMTPAQVLQDAQVEVARMLGPPLILDDPWRYLHVPKGFLVFE